MTDVAMAPVNGVLSPQPEAQLDMPRSPSAGSTKRKRVESSEEPAQTNGLTKSMLIDASSTKIHEQIGDLIAVLKRFDTNPSILDHPIPSRNDTKEPDAKRSRSDEANTVLTRVGANLYETFDSVIADIEAVSKSLADSLHLPSDTNGSQYMPVSGRDSQLATHIDLFVKKAEDLANRQKAYNGVNSGGGPKKELDTPSYLLNGNTSSIPNNVSDATQGKVALTLFGNAPNARQLFSSLQETVNAPNGTITAPRPLREVALPNNITTTRITQANAFADDKKRSQTLGELFSMSSSLPFQPPKSSRLSSGKGLAAGWSQPSVSENARTRSNQSYYSQQVSTGQWLEYTGASSHTDPKRKQRERALSLSGAKVSLSEAQTEEQEAAKLDALFRSAYSSFAPTKDDAAAVVPEGMLNRIWWQRVGEKSFERLANNIGNIALLDEKTGKKVEDPIEKEDALFKDAVDHWDEVIDPSLQEPSSTANEKSVEEKDVDEILEGISELLETLNSYQRNRNLALPSIPRSGILSAETSSSLPQPTEEETATYNILKAQLALMIATLPPYAVAKLNSSQLADLNISTKIPVLTDTYKGVLEEDEHVARAKVAAMSTAASTRQPASTLSNNRSSSSSLYGNQYNSSSRTAGNATAQYYQTSTPARAPTRIVPPQTAGPVPFAAGRPIAGTNYRPQAPYAPPTYAHQMPRAAPAQQYAPSAQAYYQTPTTQKYSQISTMPPQTAPQATRYQQPGQEWMQGRQGGPTNGVGYGGYPNANGTPIARQPSPQKPLQSAPLSAQGYNTHLPPQQARYAPSTPSAPQGYYAGVSNNGMAASQQALPAGMPMQQQPPQQDHKPYMPTAMSGGVRPLGPTGYHSTMTPEQQAIMMDRQRQQIAQQQGVQAQARNAAQAGVLGSPAKPPGQMSGTNSM